MVSIRTESAIDSNFSVPYRDDSNFDESEKNILMYSCTLMVESYTLGSLLHLLFKKCSSQ